jgi:hypothetical protein
MAGFLLVAGAAAAIAAPTLQSTASSLFSAPSATSSPDSTPAPTDENEGENGGAGDSDGGKWFGGKGGVRVGVGDLLDEVLTDLVGQGVITQAQADAIVAALESAVDEQRADVEAELDQLRDMWEQIRGFAEDGVITEEEIAQLPADSMLSELFNSIAQDGEINLDELRNLGPDMLPGLPGMGRGFDGPGPRMDGPGFWFDMTLPGDPGAETDSNSDSGSSSNS